MEKLNLSVQEILDKEFKVDFKGYSASEVDAFLDQVLEDYQIQEENIESLNNRIKELEEELADAKKTNRELETKQRAIDLTN